eukprot:2340055-Pyramimonas_sp.AAC.1
MAVDELKKAAPAKAPSGLSVSGSGSAPSGPAASDNTTALGGSAVPSDTAAPSGPAVSGNDATTWAAQPSRESFLAPATGVQEAKPLGEAAEEYLRNKCPVGKSTVLSQMYKFPRRLRTNGYPNRNEDWELDWPYHLSYQTTKKLPYRSAPGQDLVDHGFLRSYAIASGKLRRGMMRNNEYPLSLIHISEPTRPEPI